MEGWDGVFVRETGGVEPSVRESQDIEGVEEQGDRLPEEEALGEGDGHAVRLYVG